MISSFDIAKLHSLLKDFYQLTKIRITVFDDSFRELTSYPDEIADFCKLIRQTPGCAMKCHLCDRHACEIASRRTSSYTYHCHAGLTESIIPIRMGNIVIGYLLFGHVFSYTSYDEGWKVIRERCADYGISFDELEKCCRKLPNLSEEYIDSASHIMKAVASYLCMDRMVSMHQQELPVQIDEYIQSHYTERIDAVSIAQHFHIGKRRFMKSPGRIMEWASRNISGNCGLTWQDSFWRSRRICHLLRLPISVVSVIIIILSRYLRSWSEFHRSRTGNRS